MKPELTYLAIPYSHPDASVREKRFKLANKFSSILMSRGKFVYSPISHTHPMSIENNLPTHWEFWEALDTVYLKASKELIVATVDGWKQSKGVNAEIRIAQVLGLPISYMAEYEFENL